MKKKIILIILFGIVSIISFLLFFGFFVSEVSVTLQNIFNFKDGTLCIIKLDFTADGAFAANQNINTKIRLYKSETQLDQMGIKGINVLFLDSYDLSKIREDGLTETVSIELFYNPISDIFEGESSFLRYDQSGKYSFLINIYEDDDQIPDQVIFSDSEISITSPEILPVLKYNVWTITIALLTLIIAFVSAFFKN
ncbi:MAG: hypothetical protein KAK00_07625 [Nanoarchaeota archaeon]|nr:hypothetical protein [Nanoarchaeota archaeon]